MNLNLSEEELRRIDKSPLLQFLDSQRVEGRFDSEAEFSISLEAAQRKLGRFALPRPSAWVLKFVQCANELACERLDVVLTESSVSLAFPPGALAPLDVLYRRLESMRPESEAESHLFAGIAVLNTMPGKLEITDDRFHWEVGDAPSSSENGRVGARLEHHAEKLSFWQRLKARLSKTLDVLEELQHYAYASPVPVFVDTLAVHRSQEAVVLLNGVLTDHAKVRLRVGSGVLTGDDDRSSVFCSWGANRSSNYSACVRIEHRARVAQPNICLDWVRSGVVVKREGKQVPGSDRLLSRTLVSADGLKFDLSGFDFGETEESKQRRRRGAFFTWYGLRGLEKMMRENKWNRFLREHPPLFEARTAEELESEIHALYEVLGGPGLKIGE